MHSVIDQMLEMFGIVEIPTSFPEFMYWLCSLIAGIVFLKFCVAICFNFAYELGGRRR